MDVQDLRGDTRAGVIRWIHPVFCSPPHRVTHPEHADALAIAIHENGWQGPALLGYIWRAKIQLISGSHRWAACTRLGHQLPILLLDYPDVWKIWGSGEWMKILASAPWVSENSFGGQNGLRFRELPLEEGVP